MRGTLSQVRAMVRASISTVMEHCTKVHGKMTKETERDLTPGQMATSTLENIPMESKKAKVL